ncbi:hypothetical protein EPI10_029284 [Gossypium australe]|uniref:Uncharacterized protein n=1 Tax=Gossypium australe TaxID=47621 RepID=A0A5B6V1H2_9ROSI|nr:hypothetical protein EPI10_029284 [Gossypium australe]
MAIRPLNKNTRILPGFPGQRASRPLKRRRFRLIKLNKNGVVSKFKKKINRGLKKSLCPHWSSTSGHHRARAVAYGGAKVNDANLDCGAIEECCRVLRSEGILVTAVRTAHVGHLRRLAFQKP